MKILLKQPDIEIDSLRKKSNMTPIMTAIENHALEAVKLLVESGCSFEDGKLRNQYLKINPHPINFAIKNDENKIVEYLLTQERALKNFTNIDMNEALESAQANQNIEMTVMLCNFVRENSKFAPKNTIDYFITQAIRRDYPVAILDALFEIGNVDYSFQNERDGLTLLHVAVMAKNAEAIKYLVEKGANTNVKNQSNDTPFSMAMKKKYENIAEILASDPNLNINMKIGKSTYLALAKAKKFDNVCRILQEKGAIQ